MNIWPFSTFQDNPDWNNPHGRAGVNAIPTSLWNFRRFIPQDSRNLFIYSVPWTALLEKRSWDLICILTPDQTSVGPIRDRLDSRCKGGVQSPRRTRGRAETKHWWWNYDVWNSLRIVSDNEENSMQQFLYLFLYVLLIVRFHNFFWLYIFYS